MRRGGPPGKVCFVCGRMFGSSSLEIHQKQCLAKREAEQARLPKSMRTKLVNPNEIAGGNDMDGNDAAFSAYKSNLAPCNNCGRTFLPDRLVIHQRSCKPGSEAKRSPVNRTSGRPSPSSAGRTSDRASPAGRPAGRRPTPAQQGRALDGEEEASPPRRSGGSSRKAPARTSRLAEMGQDAMDKVDGDRMPCPDCGRKFLPESLQKHTKICRKVFGSKRKTFNTTKQRVEGSEAAAYARRGGFKPVEKTKTNWRQKHEEFIRTVRSARKVDAVLKAGGDISSLPPPPRDEHPEYVGCPHCGRRFNESAAERHIPRCATTINKPKPPPSTNRYAKGGEKHMVGMRDTKSPAMPRTTRTSAGRSPASASADHPSQRRSTAGHPPTSRTPSASSRARTSRATPESTRPSAKFCGQCGTSFVKATQKFCGNCGSPR